MGFFWWEVDISYYALSLLSFFGLVWDMKKPSQRVLETREPEAYSEPQGCILKVVA